MVEKNTFQLRGSRNFTNWLNEAGASVAFTTYQCGKVFFVGLSPENELSVFERTFNRCMGMWASDQTLYLGSLFQIWRFENLLPPGQIYQGYDRLYVPQVGYTTGDVDAHDIAAEAGGPILFANTLFSCLARVSDRYSFDPVWRPPFISKLAAEDRCHLNGLAMRDGVPAYVTSIAASDANEGWREHRQNGGVVIDVQGNDIICTGLSMPHSPRLYRGKLWILNSGTGEFGHVEPDTGRFVPVAFCPGYLRGLNFIGDHAVVGLSKPRRNGTFSGLSLDERLSGRNVSARCAVQVIDLIRGDVAHELRIEGVVEELYDVCILPGVRRPMALGFKTEEIRRVLSLPPESG